MKRGKMGKMVQPQLTLETKVESFTMQRKTKRVKKRR
jgi:hypothetical protein